MILIILAIFIGYITYIVNKFGVLPSISESYYRLPSNKKFLFIIFLWGIGMPFAALTGDIYGFITCTGLMFVGGAALFKRSGTSLIHYLGAGIGIGSAQLYMTLELKLWWLTALFIILTLGLYGFKVRNKIWWVEVVAFTTIIIGLILKIIG